MGNPHPSFKEGSMQHITKALFTVLSNLLGLRDWRAARLPAIAGGSPASFAGETGGAPLVRTHRMRHTGEAAAGTDFEEVMLTVEFGCIVTGARFIPDATVAGSDTLTNTLAISNRTQTLTPASTTYPAASGFTAFTSKAFTLGNAANQVVAQGDVLTFKKTHLSTGTQGPSGTVEVDISRTDIT